MNNELFRIPPIIQPSCISQASEKPTLLFWQSGDQLLEIVSSTQTIEIGVSLDSVHVLIPFGNRLPEEFDALRRVAVRPAVALIGRKLGVFTGSRGA